MKFKADIFKEYTEEISKYMYRGLFNDLEAVEHFIIESQSKMEDGDVFSLAILDNKTQEFLGGAEIDLLYENKKTPKMGFWIKLSAHGHGYGKEIATALKKWADENIEYDYLLYIVSTKNIPSCKIAELLGLILGREYEAPDMDGQMHSLREYRAMNEE